MIKHLFLATKYKPLMEKIREDFPINYSQFSALCGGNRPPVGTYYACYTYYGSRLTYLHRSASVPIIADDAC